MTLLSSLVGIPRAPILPYAGCGRGGRGRSGARPPVAVPTVNASALVTTPTVEKTNFMVSKPSRPGATAAYARWANTVAPMRLSPFTACLPLRTDWRRQREFDASFSTFHPTRHEFRPRSSRGPIRESEQTECWMQEYALPVRHWQGTEPKTARNENPAGPSPAGFSVKRVELWRVRSRPRRRS
jgi:hypothetical protein